MGKLCISVEVPPKLLRRPNPGISKVAAKHKSDASSAAGTHQVEHGLNPCYVLQECCAHISANGMHLRWAAHYCHRGRHPSFQTHTEPCRKDTLLTPGFPLVGHPLRLLSSLPYLPQSASENLGAPASAAHAARLQENFAHAPSQRSSMRKLCDR